MNKHVALIIAAAAVAFGVSGCSLKYIEFPVWEGHDQAHSTAKKQLPICAGSGGCPKTYEKLEQNDVDGAIALLEEDTNKSAMVWAYLAVLYEVKHDWTKAEEAIQKAIADGGDSASSYEKELAFIQEHKAKYVSQ